MSTHWCVIDAAAGIDRGVLTLSAHFGGGVS